MSEATMPVKVSPCWVVALSRVWVMRMGRVVPGVRVTLRKAGRGGGGGGGGGAVCCGGGGGVGLATRGAGVSHGPGRRAMGAGVDFTAAAGPFGCGGGGI